jgi:hypothetical protein
MLRFESEQQFILYLSIEINNPTHTKLLTGYLSFYGHLVHILHPLLAIFLLSFMYDLCDIYSYTIP